MLRSIPSYFLFARLDAIRRSVDATCFVDATRCLNFLATPSLVLEEFRKHPQRFHAVRSRRVVELPFLDPLVPGQRIRIA